MKYKEKLIDLEQKYSAIIEHLVSTQKRTEKITGDFGDRVTANYEQSVAIQALTQNQDKLIKIRQALERIRLGIFGFCEVTGEPIEEARLAAILWTTLSLEGAEIKEKEALTMKRRL